MITFENYDRKIEKINKALAAYGIASLEVAEKLCKEKGIDPYKIAREIQPICFEDVCWAYVAGAAIAIQKGCSKANEAAKAIGEGLQAFCLPGSVQRTARSVSDTAIWRRCCSVKTECFCVSGGAMSHLQRPGAIGIMKSANKSTGKKAFACHSERQARYVPDYFPDQRFHLCADTVQLLYRSAYGRAARFRIPRRQCGSARCYGADDVREVLPSCKAGVDVSITASIPRVRPVSSIRSQAHTKGMYPNRAKEIFLRCQRCGGAGRTLHRTMAAGHCLYGMTDTAAGAYAL